MNNNNPDDTEHEPLAWSFEVEPDHPNGESFQRVSFDHPSETYGAYEDFTIRNVRPLYTETEQ